MAIWYLTIRLSLYGICNITVERRGSFMCEQILILINVNNTVMTWHLPRYWFDNWQEHRITVF